MKGHSHFLVLTFCFLLLFQPVHADPNYGLLIGLYFTAVSTLIAGLIIALINLFSNNGFVRVLTWILLVINSIYFIPVFFSSMLGFNVLENEMMTYGGIIMLPTYALVLLNYMNKIAIQKNWWAYGLLIWLFSQVLITLSHIAINLYGVHVIEIIHYPSLALGYAVFIYFTYLHHLRYIAQFPDMSVITAVRKGVLIAFISSFFYLFYWFQPTFDLQIIVMLKNLIVQILAGITFSLLVYLYVKRKSDVENSDEVG